MSILKITGRQILDSRGYPTVEVDLVTRKGLFRAAVPSGASTGIHEANEMRDSGPEYHGKGVMKAVNNVNKIIAPALIKKNLCVTEQHAIDEFMVTELDGTKNKTHLGANAILAVSLAVLKAGAAEKNLPVYRWVANLAGNEKVTLPVPAFNVLNGGKHAGNRLAFQEFMILPVGAKSFAEAVRMGSETYHCLRNIIKAKYGLDACNVGDEGGFAPNISTPHDALDLLVDAISNAGYVGKILIGMDVASSEMYTTGGKYNMNFKDARQDPNQLISGDKLLDTYISLLSHYPIVSIEDPFDQDDWEHGIKFRSRSKVQIVGDDLLVTNPERVRKAIELGACNALLLKVNQIGSFTEALEACQMAKRANWKVMVSHRSGETGDSTIADLAVGLNCGQIKTGAPCRSERLAKYNQLLRIEEELGCHAVYAGNVFKQSTLC
uniref:Enolase n=1 Tax=Clonorchis sinensis TaxID=79923 RepID=F4ZMJ2_CLOSI|nr:enolase [Clonorchis sinensis]